MRNLENSVCILSSVDWRKMDKAWNAKLIICAVFLWRLKKLNVSLENLFLDDSQDEPIFSHVIGTEMETNLDLVAAACCSDDRKNQGNRKRKMGGRIDEIQQKKWWRWIIEY